MSKTISLFIAIMCIQFSFASHAQTLTQVYKEAKENNPDLQKALAERNAAYEAINLARSPLLPQLDLSGNYNDNSELEKNQTATLQLTQTLFDMARFRQLTLAEKRANIQDIVYQITEQNLILDTATAYFNVLRMIDILFYIKSNKKATYRELDQTEQRFKAGLVAITDVQNAQAQYDQIVAIEVNASNNLDNSLEHLRQITGKYYNELNSLNIKQFFLQHPESIDNLLKQADKNNLSLLLSRLNQELAREQIKLEKTGYIPTLSFTASSSRGNAAYQPFIPSHNITNRNEKNKYRTQNNMNIILKIPLYSGGSTNSKVKQAKYSYVSASESLESVYRSTIQTVRSSFNNISAAISSIKAYQQVVKSAQSSLSATKIGYRVGTRTIVDILRATSSLYDAKQKLTDYRYTYLIGLLNLKYALGTLTSKDLDELDYMLSTPQLTVTKNITVNTQMKK